MFHDQLGATNIKIINQSFLLFALPGPHLLLVAFHGEFLQWDILKYILWIEILLYLV